MHPRTRQCVDIVGDVHGEMAGISDSETVFVNAIKDKRYKSPLVIIEGLGGRPNDSYFKIIQQLGDKLRRQEDAGKLRIEYVEFRDNLISWAYHAVFKDDNESVNSCAQHTFEDLYSVAFKNEKRFSPFRAYGGYCMFYPIVADEENSLKLTHLWEQWKQKFIHAFARILESCGMDKKAYLCSDKDIEKLNTFWHQENGLLFDLLVVQLADLGFLLEILRSNESCLLYIGDGHAKGVEKLLIQHFGFIRCFNCYTNDYGELPANIWTYLLESPSVSYKRLIDYLKAEHQRTRRR
jgi:hypothetical protein